MVDARMRIIQKNRMRVKDAREKLNDIAKLSDARTKIRGRNFKVSWNICFVDQLWCIVDLHSRSTYIYGSFSNEKATICLHLLIHYNFNIITVKSMVIRQCNKLFYQLYGFYQNITCIMYADWKVPNILKLNNERLLHLRSELDR